MTASRLSAARVQYAAVVAFAAVLPLGQAPAEIALVIGLIAWAFRTVRERRGSQLLRNPLSGLLLLWFLAALASMANSIDPVASLHGLRKLLKGFGLFLLVVDTVDSRDALRGVVAGSLVGLSLVVGDGLWQWAAGRDLLYGHVPVNELPTGKTVLRLTAMFGHSASLAIHLVSWSPLAIAVGLAGDRRWRPWLLGLGILAAVVLVFSRTRGGIVGFACALPLMSWWLQSPIPAAVGLAAAALQAATVPPAVAEWAASMPTLLHQFTEPERLLYWQAALRMVQAHPLIGVGVNTFVKAYPAYRVAGDPYAVLGPYAHNQYLQVAAELGLIGLAVFATVLVRLGLALRRGLAARSGHPFEAAVAAGVGAGLVGYLILGGLESSLFYGRGALIFWTLAGLLVAVELQMRRLSRTGQSPPRLLFIRTDRLGETLLALPAAAALRAAYPQARLTLLMQPALQPLLAGVPGIDEVLAYDGAAPSAWWRRALRLGRALRPRRFDVAVVSNPKKELHLAVWLAGIPVRAGYGRKWGGLLTHRVPDRKALGERHEVEYNLELVSRVVGPLTTGSIPTVRLPLREEEQGTVRQLLARHGVQGSDPFLVVHPWTSNPVKRWPAARYRELVRMMAQRLPVVVVGGPEAVGVTSDVIPAGQPRVVNLVGGLSLSELAELLRSARLLVSNDSGPVHLAAAVGTPTVVLFGGSSLAAGPRRWGPLGEGHTVIWKGSMEDITVDDVVAVVRGALER